MRDVDPDELFVVLSYGEVMVRLGDIDKLYKVDTEYVSGKGRIPKMVKSLAGNEVVVVDGRAVIAALARMKMEVGNGDES